MSDLFRLRKAKVIRICAFQTSCIINPMGAISPFVTEGSHAKKKNRSGIKNHPPR
jgi:hypothetical protein